MTVRARIAVAAGRAVGALSRALGRGRGNQIAGRVMLGVDPSLPTQLAAGRRITLVSATNGKTTTTALLAAAASTGGRRVATNDDGANLMAGLVAALAGDDAPLAVLETDEAQLPAAIAALDPSLVVLGELSRDQLDRMHEVRHVAARWRDALAGTRATVVATSTDPNVAWAAAGERTVWVDLGPVQLRDARCCPACGTLLAAEGERWACDCGFIRPDAHYRLETGSVQTPAGTVAIDLAVRGGWQQANAALALAAAHELGVDPHDAAAAMAAVARVGHRRPELPLGDGRSAQILLAKNPASWEAILDEYGDSDVGLVVAQNDLIADGVDPSWLWDVPFEVLAGRPAAAAGTRCLDVAVRLRTAGAEPVIVDRDPLAAARAMPNEQVVIGASYTLFTPMVARP